MALWLIGCRAEGDAGIVNGPARVGQPAPTLALADTGGLLQRLDQQRGRVVLINFWATWCGPCREEMPALQALADNLAGKSFSLWLVNLQEESVAVVNFGRELGLRAPLLLDSDGEVTRRFGVRALPATFLVDGSGVVRQQRLGPLVPGAGAQDWSPTWLEQKIRALGA